jgi:hypothetical protein
MERGRPHGRSKSDERVCQEARHARAAEYRERINISAEQQKARIAAVNVECDLQDAPQKRRSQKSNGLKKKAWTARRLQRGHCKASGSGRKKEKKKKEEKRKNQIGASRKCLATLQKEVSFWCMCF